MRAQSLIETASSVETNRRITELHLWAVHEGLRGAPPLWRAFAGMRTLHPQWAGYTYSMGRLHLHLVARPQWGQPGTAPTR
jgi:hypothetical protein